MIQLVVASVMTCASASMASAMVVPDAADPYSDWASGRLSRFFYKESVPFIYFRDTDTLLNIAEEFREDTTGGANDVNEFGQVVGWIVDGNKTHPFLFDPIQGLQILTFSDGYLGPGEAKGINSKGQVVGTVLTENGGRAFIWDATFGIRLLNDYITLPEGVVLASAEGISDNGIVYGTANTPNGPAAYLFSEATGLTTALDPKMIGWDVASISSKSFNRGGELAGVVVGENGERSGFFWSSRFGASAMKGPSDEWYSISPNSLNDSGFVVGSGSIDEVQRALIWSSPEHSLDLNDLLPNEAGVEFIEATAIDNEGRIVAYAREYGRNIAYLLSPEPRRQSTVSERRAEHGSGLRYELKRLGEIYLPIDSIDKNAIGDNGNMVVGTCNKAAARCQGFLSGIDALIARLGPDITNLYQLGFDDEALSSFLLPGTIVQAQRSLTGSGLTGSGLTGSGNAGNGSSGSSGDFGGGGTAGPILLGSSNVIEADATESPAPPSPVPLPSAASLLLVGLGGFFPLFRCRRRRIHS
jgi:probable HAF family extracellular repeat protein